MKSRSRFLLRHAVRVLTAGLLAALLVAGCGKSTQESPGKGAGREDKPPARPGSVASAPVVEGPGKDEKVCFACNGQGTVPCRAPGCVGGKTDCPGACLKLTRGTWIHMTVAGHDPSEVWQKFYDSDGKGWQAYNQNHVGHVVAMQNGHAVDIGPCKICGGTTKVACSVCKGQGRQTCQICNGKKFIPVAWTETDNPWFNNQPDLIRLKDDRYLLGKVVISSGEDRTIMTREHKLVHVKASDILPKTNSAPLSPAQGN